MADWTIPIASQRRLDREQALVAAEPCDTCKDRCAHQLGDTGCAHYGCLGANAELADSCPAAIAAISAAL